jgi:hypothetical protein
MPDPVWRRFLWLAAAVLGMAGCAAGAAKHPVSDKASTAEAIQPVTGIAACDNYLASYQACHRAAHIYPTEQIAAHYQTMRASLLQSSQDPAARAQLSARCLGLSLQQRQMLQGQNCTIEPISATH